jgi:hypothetical protein
MLAQGKAIMFTGKNVMQAAKLPKKIQDSLESTKEELNMLKEATEDVKNNFPKMADHGKQCADDSVTDCVPCYKKINGAIPHT